MNNCLNDGKIRLVGYRPMLKKICPFDSHQPLYSHFTLLLLKAVENLLDASHAKLSHDNVQTKLLYYASSVDWMEQKRNKDKDNSNNREIDREIPINYNKSYLSVIREYTIFPICCWQNND